MTSIAVSVDNVWKQFRLYHDKNQYLKTALLRGGRARYEEFWALQGITFDIPTGSTFGIIGSNGSGKSTLLKCLTGILQPEKGNISLNGRIAALLELGAGFHPELSGRENIFLNGAILGMSKKDIEKNLDTIIDFSGLEHFIETPVKNYSSGMTVRLGFAIAINVDPDILIIDEVLAVGDAVFQQKCLEKIEDFRKDGRTIVLVSHGLSDVARICEKVAWIEKGVLRELGSAVEVIDNYNKQNHGSKPLNEDGVGQRWGSGEVQFEGIELNDFSGINPQAFESGQTLTISANLISAIKIENAVISISISQLHGLEIWGSSTRSQNLQFDIPIGASRVDINLIDLPLLEGTYELTMTVTDSSQVHVYDCWEKGKRFDIRQENDLDSGFMKLQSRWSIAGIERT